MFVHNNRKFNKTSFTEILSSYLRGWEAVQNVPKKFLDHMTGTDGLFEIRIEFESNIYRIFCCFDKGNLVVLFNGFQKKSAAAAAQKTQKKEIELALKLKEEYFNFKTKK